eukprot:PLAT4992.4.p1 GENE.PLAT4992.4~~PLAT4992.4.p1  ORF type:complete len:196 (-),score=21.28 PLAT4992.4:91-678(-)
MHKAKTLLRRLRSEGSLRDAEARENSPTSLQPDDVGGRDGLEHLRETRKRSFSSARRSSITDLDLAGALPSLVEVVEVHDEVCAADFDAKFVVGKGSFSEVIKVRHRLTNRTWALKVVSKERVLEDRLLAQITREKTLLEELPPHPFVITLQAVSVRHVSALYCYFSFCLLVHVSHSLAIDAGSLPSLRWPSLFF